jgi:hypothetical protein
MDVATAVLQGLGYLFAAAALCYAPLGRLAAIVLMLGAILGAVIAGFGPGERDLLTTHTFVAYRGQELDPTAVHFPTGTKTAPGWQWPLPYAGFALIWSVILLRRRSQNPEDENPYVLPLALGWTAMAAWLGMQFLAAPEDVVQPYALERFLWPAGLALALRSATTVRSLLVLLMLLAVGATALRLPAALFSKYAQLGTSLDVHTITDIVHPIQRAQFEPPLEPGSAAQQFWLIWAEHVIVFPSLHLMSYFGFAFAIWLMQRQHGKP